VQWDWKPIDRSDDRPLLGLSWNGPRRSGQRSRSTPQRKTDLQSKAHHEADDETRPRYAQEAGRRSGGVYDMLLQKNSEEDHPLSDQLLHWIESKAFDEFEEKGMAAGPNQPKPSPIFLAKDAITKQFDLARDSAKQPYYYDHERFTWRRGVDKFTPILLEKFEAEGKAATSKNAIDLDWNLGQSIEREFYAEPPTDRINLLNGILNIKTLELTPHSEKSMEFLWPNQFPHEWNPQAKCPTWNKVLETCLGSDEAIVISEWIGYVCAADTDSQKALLLQGPGGNGKTIVIEVIRFMVGEENCSNITFQDLESRFQPAGLVGKLLNIDSDVTNRAIPGSQTFMKLVSGKDSMIVEKKFHDPVDNVRPYARLLFSCNPFPRCHNNSEAFWTRWIVLRFLKRSFREGQKDHSDHVPATELLARLKAEASGILYQSIMAYRAMLAREQRDFTKTANMKTWMNDFRLATDSLSVWLENNVILNPNAVLRQNTLRIAYNAYCEKNNIATMTAADFSAKVQEMRPTIRSGQNNHNDATFVGLGWLAGSTWAGVE
jgi:P4 family phage/plasmid primase-like protien